MFNLIYLWVFFDNRRPSIIILVVIINKCIGQLNDVTDTSAQFHRDAANFRVLPLKRFGSVKSGHPLMISFLMCFLPIRYV